MKNKNSTENGECDITGNTSMKSGERVESDIIIKSGIYKIINKLNGKYYVGSSNDIDGTYGRWYEHINNLNSNRHENQHLQRAWNKYGQHSFEFVVVKRLPIQNLLDEEQSYLDIAKGEKDKTYNMAFLSSGGGGFTGHKHTEKSKQQTSLKMKGRTKGTKGIKRPHTSGINNSRWIVVDSDVTQKIIYLYKDLGYKRAKQHAKERYGVGATVFYRLVRNLTKTKRQTLSFI